jgi:hypothetical protein
MKSTLARFRFLHAGTFILGAAFALAARGQDGPQAVIVKPTTPEQLEVQRIGETAINRLAVSMTNEVKSALRGGDPADAVDFCHLKGLPTTPGAMIRGIPQIVAIKFTSLKTRATDNLPDPSDKQALESIQKALNSGGDIPAVVVQRIDIPNGAPEWRVYKPIATSSSCLVCHGDPADQTPRLQAKLKALYPDDQATGYKEHEWRGVIRVTVSGGPDQ